jgi:hypothetical protein
MAPSSITIKIDFGPENVTGTTNNVSLQGDIPTPFSLGGLSSATLGQSAATLPTPFDNPPQSVAVVNDQAPTPLSGTAGQADLTAPVPSPNISPAGSMGNEDEVPQDVHDSGKKGKKS